MEVQSGEVKRGTVRKYCSNDFPVIDWENIDLIGLLFMKGLLFPTLTLMNSLPCNALSRCFYSFGYSQQWNSKKSGYLAEAVQF